MDQDDVLSKISSENTTAHELLSEAMPNAASRFYRTAKPLPTSGRGPRALPGCFVLCGVWKFKPAAWGKS
jgi:hypothetical protein